MGELGATILWVELGATYGNRSFAVSGPTTLNSLPVTLQSNDAAEETF